MTEQYGSSTTASYSGAQSSSIGRSTHDAVIQQESILPAPPVAPQPSNYISWEAWIIPVIGMALTGVIGYYSSMMSLKEEISSNRENVSVLKNDVVHIKSDLIRVESEAENGDDALRRSDRLEIRVENLKLRLSEHIADTKNNHNK